jgi:DNA-directed RNA polymerase specialized sigma24 family protein
MPMKPPMPRRKLSARWRAIDKFRGDSAFATWLHRIALNVTHDARADRS